VPLKYVFCFTFMILCDILSLWNAVLYLVSHVIDMLYFPYMTSFQMTTCVLSFSEITKNRNSLKTMSYSIQKRNLEYLKIIMQVFTFVNFM